MISFENDGYTIHPFGEPDREWALFFCFGVVELFADPVGWSDHVGWIRGRPFETITEYFGPEGVRFRARLSMHEPSENFKARWGRFLTKHRDDSMEYITNWVQALVDEFSDEPKDKIDFETRVQALLAVDRFGFEDHRLHETIS